ncbi:MAG: hypothetical protein R3250_17145, partial [Melioribacteraceae bacterium]|nr:hypothetical protein [Melioribacteraceae bacterium]
MACEQDSNFFVDEESMITQQSDYALQAEELLKQLTPEQRKLLSPEDIAEFKKGPELDVMTRNQSHHYGSWHPVLAIFNCEANEGMTTGDGHWFGHGHSTLEIDVTPNLNSGFEDGNFILINPDHAKLMGPYLSNRAHRFGYQR